MTELSLNILDIVQNSVRAGATRIEISINESIARDSLELKIIDNGCGIPLHMISTVDDPFTTSRSTRKTGLGLPLLKHHAQLTGGNIEIRSDMGKGTEVNAYFGHAHIDRQPLGDITGVLIILIAANPGIDFLYSHKTDTGMYNFSTLETKQVLETERLDDRVLLEDLRGMIKENLMLISVSD